TMRPPGALTRAISAAAARGSGAKITPNTDVTMSASSSASGRAAASPSAKAASSPRAAASRRATPRSRRAGSTPATGAPRPAARHGRAALGGEQGSGAGAGADVDDALAGPGCAALDHGPRGRLELRRGVLVAADTPVERAHRIIARPAQAAGVLDARWAAAAS